jgi:hypothetical protein
MGCVGSTTVLEGGTVDGGDMISSGKNEITDKSFIAVDDEVAAKLLRLFMSFNKFSRRCSFEVTPN